ATRRRGELAPADGAGAGRRRGARHRRADARSIGGPCQDARTVRPANRLLPGREAPVRGHGGAHRGGPLDRDLRRGGAPRPRARGAAARAAVEGPRHLGRARQRARQRAEPRWDGLHVGGGRAPLSQAGVAARARLRHAHGASRGAGRALARGLSYNEPMLPGPDGGQLAAPPPAAPAGRTWLEAGFPALRHRNFRLFVVGQGTSLIGFWMQSVAQGWLVYRLSGSAFAVGLVAFCGYLPILCCAPAAGVLFDRVSRHRLLIATQTILMLLALGVAALIAAHRITVHLLMIFAAGV